MQIYIDYETTDGKLVHLSYYESFLRNKDLRDELGKQFFNTKAKVEILKKRFIEYSEENKIDQLETKKVIENVFEKDDENYPYLNPLVTSIYSDNFNQFFMNIFYNAIKYYFNSNAVSLGLYLAFNPSPNMMFSVRSEEISQWIELLERYQYIKLCPAMNWYLYQKKSPYPLKRLFEDFKNNNIKGNIIIRNELASWTYKSDIISELEEELDSLDSNDECERNSLEEEIETTEKLSEFELMEMKIISEEQTLYKSLKEVLEIEIVENEIFEKLKNEK